jgi:HIRAN domain
VPVENQIIRDFSIMGSMFLKFGNAVDLIKRLRPNTPLRFVREPKNVADPNACIVVWDVPTGGTVRPTALGYVPRGLAKELAPIIDSGKKVIARKAPNVLHGVCQAAWIGDAPATPAPAPAASAPDVDLSAPVDDAPQVTNFEPEPEPASTEVPADEQGPDAL